MILFDLCCSNNHVFEGWFASTLQYEKQKKMKLISCPICGDTKISKSLMAPNISSKSNKKVKSSKVINKSDTKNILQDLKKFKNIIEKNTTDVGKNFAEEARKIYYGETKNQAIRGETSAEDAKELKEEGVPFASIPWFPKEDA